MSQMTTLSRRDALLLVTTMASVSHGTFAQTTGRQPEMLLALDAYARITVAYRGATVSFTPEEVLRALLRKDEP